MSKNYGFWIVRLNFKVLLKNNREYGSIKPYFLWFQEDVQHKAEFEGVLASILKRFLKVLQEQKCGFVS